MLEIRHQRHQKVVRNLALDDYQKGFLKLLNQLTPTTIECSFDKFAEEMRKMMTINPMTSIYVIEEDGMIVATAKLFIEYKLHNGFTYMGHIEDVVVNKECRGKGYGKKIMEHVRDEAIKKYDCYKVVLDCSNENVAFYEKCGFKRKGNEMAVYKTPY